jgi:2-polyprenyl-3-methyl-5-hydroxy-6-metoxy-1,4-benzoquinol methylase
VPSQIPKPRIDRPVCQMETREISCPWCGGDDGVIVVTPQELIRWTAPGEPHPFAFKRCIRCALVYLSPQPVNLDEVYPEDYHAHVISGRQHSRLKRWSRRMLMRVFMGYPPPLPTMVAGVLRAGWAKRWARFKREHGHMLVPWAGSGQGRLLDVGSGAGSKLCKYRELGWRVTGVESDPKAVCTARESFQLDVREGFLETQGFAPESFDAITLNFVLEHVPHPRRLLTLCHELLAPEGALLIDVPNFNSGMREIFGPCWSQYALPLHWLLPTDATLRLMVSECGFEVSSVQHYASSGLYCVSHRQAMEIGRLPKGLPGPDDEQALDAWLEKQCATPHGELMLLLARKR